MECDAIVPSGFAVVGSRLRSSHRHYGKNLRLCKWLRRLTAIGRNRSFESAKLGSIEGSSRYPELHSQSEARGNHLADSIPAAFASPASRRALEVVQVVQPRRDSRGATS